MHAYVPMLFHILNRMKCICMIHKNTNENHKITCCCIVYYIFTKLNGRVEWKLPDMVNVQS